MKVNHIQLQKLKQYGRAVWAQHCLKMPPGPIGPQELAELGKVFAEGWAIGIIEGITSVENRFHKLLDAQDEVKELGKRFF